MSRGIYKRTKKRGGWKLSKTAPYFYLSRKKKMRQEKIKDWLFGGLVVLMAILYWHWIWGLIQ